MADKSEAFRSSRFLDFFRNVLRSVVNLHILGALGVIPTIYHEVPILHNRPLPVRAVDIINDQAGSTHLLHTNWNTFVVFQRWLYTAVFARIL